ncbi:integrin beta-PS isoform X1 [Diorhabda sublineata]|uniref:integrin beta-PS isoform X1 n=1 Tax=Diorhabda sublineata TaxID=1163346 RepID=UPI0024E11185|nr:integrin beta-PS isoform X1 [Diorhabda sublineata]
MAASCFCIMEAPWSKSFLRNCLILSIISTVVIAQLTQRFSSPNPCTSKGKCHECIQTPGCAWCYDPNFGDGPRCFQPSLEYQQQKKCLEEFVLNPDNILSVLSNLELTKARKGNAAVGGTLVTGVEGSYNASEHWSVHGSETGSAGGGGAAGSAGGNIVQVAPQRLNLKLRARQSYSISMQYTQAEDYPVDLYYLMDLSKSMYDDKEKLSYLGDSLANTMKKLTSNFRLGFGSFVDKVVMPYVSTLPENLIHPCEDCAAPYGYKHALKLSTDTQQFSRMVKQANVSGNLDAPEGGFDAIMQAIVCRNQIGWREQARRLLVFSTDASFHYAGDGKLGGIVKPNDGKCHLSGDGFYTESSFQDYPSIEQINLSVKKNSINVIFAVTKSTIEIYEQLAKTIEGASVGKLEGDSSNIVTLIKEQYEQISSTVEMKHNASSALSIKFFSRCLNASGALVNTNKCGKIKVGDVVSFKIDLEVLECPKNRADHFQTIKIYPVGINESLIIDLEMLCECNCERPGDKYYKEQAPACSSMGTYKCGICECYPGAFGPHCECLPDELPTNITATDCIQPDIPNAIECSGRGQCVCKKCICESRLSENERIYGKYCECDNFSCERHDGKLCSGADHGICDCGVCHCKDEWTGTNCACIKSNASCYAPGVIDGKICSGHGRCECGVCICDSNEEGPYSGKFCDRCPTCSDRCSEFKECVQCQQYQTGPLKNPEDCSSNCTKFTPSSADVITVDAKNSEVLCAYYDEDECRFKYVYYFDTENKIQVRAQKNRDCPEKVYVPGIVLGVIAAIVLIGMAVLLLWKLLTTIHDRREFARFEKEKMMAKWDTGENPIYKQATSTFKNPTYAGKG